MEKHRFLVFLRGFHAFFGIMAKMTNVKKMFLIGLGLFIISCLLSAFSSNWGMFLVGQSLQGLADAMIVPVQAVLIRNIFSEYLVDSRDDYEWFTFSSQINGIKSIEDILSQNNLNFEDIKETLEESIFLDVIELKPIFEDQSPSSKA
ncbi:MFS transporter [Bacillus sp. 28A-2]|uniref:MFS transporter n=1 Tax=Bacillus sp. 28A-2 TaxID=2772252 RepID=UPI001CD13B42|nr:MFS transporter [Bacillus sp. 28A-2]